MGNETVLLINNMTKVYKNNRGAKDITISVEKGDILGLLGPNGSGKTTTMKAATGLCEFSEGEIKIFGHDIKTDYEAAMKRVGSLVEAPAYYDYLSAYKNLKLASRYYKDITDDDIEEMLTLVGLHSYKKDRVSRFSLGMKQRLGIAMALLSKPDLVILDEPSNGLDIEGMIEIRSIVANLAQEKGVTFLISSHLAGEIEKICNRVAIIYEGELVASASMDEALQFNPTLEDYFLSQIKDKRTVI